MIYQGLQLEVIICEKLNFIKFINSRQLIYMCYCLTNKVVIFLRRHLRSKFFFYLSVTGIWIVVELNLIIIFRFLTRISWNNFWTQWKIRMWILFKVMIIQSMRYTRDHIFSSHHSIFEKNSTIAYTIWQ